MLFRKQRKGLEQAEKERSVAREELLAIETERGELKNEIDSNNRTIASKMMHMTTRIDSVRRLLDFLQQYSQLNNDQDFKREVTLLKNSMKSSEELENSMVYFEKINSGFIGRLKELHPQLSANDVRFISYVYMQLTTKEISLLLNITPESCKKRKQRLSAKLGLADASRLYAYISEI